MRVSFNPATIPAPGSGTSTMTVTVAKKATLGNHTVTINASGGGLTHTIQVTVDVVKK